MSTQAIVTIQKILVRKAETFGATGEPGASAEWDCRFTVAGQHYRQRFDDVRDGSVVTVNKPFLVELGALESLRVEMTGYEIDDSSMNDSFPPMEHIITPATNWWDGQTFTVDAGSHPDFAYSVVFDIRRATN